MCSQSDLPLSVRFSNCLSEILNKFAPVKKRKVSHRPNAPWMNIFVKAQKQIKRKAERLFRKTGLTVHKEIFKFEKNKTIQIIKDEKKKIYFRKDIIQQIIKRTF